MFDLSEHYLQRHARMHEIRQNHIMQALERDPRLAAACHYEVDPDAVAAAKVAAAAGRGGKWTEQEDIVGFWNNAPQRLGELTESENWVSNGFVGVFALDPT